MIEKDFDIEFDVDEYIENLSAEVKESFPLDIPIDIKQYIEQAVIEKIKTSILLLKDSSRNYEVEEAMFVAQIVGEWVYHKGIDNYKNEIPEKFWDDILEEIAYSVFETAKGNLVIFRHDYDEVLDRIADVVEKTYKDLMEKLIRENQITISLDKIMEQSNLRDYIEKESLSEKINSIKTSSLNEKDLMFKKAQITNQITTKILVFSLIVVLSMILCAIFHTKATFISLLTLICIPFAVKKFS